MGKIIFSIFFQFWFVLFWENNFLIFFPILVCFILGKIIFHFFALLKTKSFIFHIGLHSLDNWEWWHLPPWSIWLLWFVIIYMGFNWNGNYKSTDPMGHWFCSQTVHWVCLWCCHHFSNRNENVHLQVWNTFFREILGEGSNERILRHFGNLSFTY